MLEYVYFIFFKDCFDVIEYVFNNGKDFGIDSFCVVIFGDSVGGYLIVVVLFCLKKKIKI